MLDAALATQLRSHLEKVLYPIELVASLDEQESKGCGREDRILVTHPRISTSAAMAVSTRSRL